MKVCHTSVLYSHGSNKLWVLFILSLYFVFRGHG